MRYFIELSYNGKNYHGWQIQPDEISIQETIEKALSLLLKEAIQVVGCGRTDTGVHASQFFLHFDCQTPIDKEKLKFKLNSYLPQDIVIFQVKKGLDENAFVEALGKQNILIISMGEGKLRMVTHLEFTDEMLSKVIRVIDSL